MNAFDDMLDQMMANAMAESATEPVSEEETVVQESEEDLGGSLGDDMGTVKERLQLEDSDDDDDDDIENDDDEDDEVDDDDLEDIADDIENMSDDDLASFASGLKDAADAGVDGDEPEVSLTPDEEMHADDLMQVAGTAALIRGEMNAEERTALLESVSDCRVGLAEGFLNDAMLADIKESTEDSDLGDAFTEAKIFNKTTVRMSKSARLNQLFEIAVTTCARAHNDPDYAKYKKACKIKKFYRAKMRIRYRAEATKRMKVLFARLRQSKSPIIKSLAKKAE